MLSQKFVFHKSKNFTSDNEIRMPPTVPINHYSGPGDQHNRTRVLSRYSMLMYSERQACFEHSNFFKVTSPAPRPDQRRPGERVPGRKWLEAGGTSAHPPLEKEGRTAPPGPRSNYELFNCNNLNIRYWSWNYRGCWHQTCPPMDPR